MNTAETMSLVARGVGGLVIVIVLILLSARLARRSRHFGGGQDLEVVDRLGISRDSQLAIVRVAGRHLLIGVGPQGVSMLSHLDDASMAFEPGAPVTALAQEPAGATAGETAPEQPAPVAAAVPPETTAPVTLADLPEDVAAELVAQFEAFAARQEDKQVAEPVAQPVVWPSFDQPPAAPAGPAAYTATEPEQPLRRRRRHAAPATDEALAAELAAMAAGGPAPAAPEPEERPEFTLPGGIQLGDYPDLASALRAAGRTTQPGPAPAPPAAVPAPRAAAEDAPAPEEPARKSRGKVRRVPQQRPEDKGVLAPSTWRQGIDALREMTVRRG